MACGVQFRKHYFLPENITIDAQNMVRSIIAGCHLYLCTFDQVKKKGFWLTLRNIYLFKNVTIQPKPAAKLVHRYDLFYSTDCPNKMLTPFDKNDLTAVQNKKHIKLH